MPGHIFDCDDWQWGATGIWSLKTKDAAKHPAVPRTDPPRTRNYPASSISSAVVAKPWFNLTQ